MSKNRKKDDKAEIVESVDSGSPAEEGAEPEGGGKTVKTDKAGDSKSSKDDSGKEQKKKKKDKSKKDKKDKPKKTPFFKEVVEEMKRVTWPGKADVAKWGVITICAIAFFTAFTMIADNFIVTPLMSFISGLTQTSDFGIIPIILTIVMFVSGILLLITIMMHSGGDGGGLSDATATSIAGSTNSTAIVERNLDRITVVLAVVFVLSIVAMMLFFPQGTISAS